MHVSQFGWKQNSFLIFMLEDRIHLVGVPYVSQGIMRTEGGGGMTCPAVYLSVFHSLEAHELLTILVSA